MVAYGQSDMFLIGASVVKDLSGVVIDFSEESFEKGMFYR